MEENLMTEQMIYLSVLRVWSVLSSWHDFQPWAVATINVGPNPPVTTQYYRQETSSSLPTDLSVFSPRMQDRGRSENVKQNLKDKTWMGVDVYVQEGLGF